MLLRICRPLKSISRQQFMEQIGAQTERIMENWNIENSEGFKESYTKPVQSSFEQTLMLLL